MELDVTRKIPTIEIDQSRCTVPYLCAKCVRTCPQAVFLVDAVKVERLKETDPREPGSFKLGTESRFKCTGCNDCIDVCPADAIAITWPR